MLNVICRIKGDEKTGQVPGDCKKLFSAETMTIRKSILFIILTCTGFFGHAHPYNFAGKDRHDAHHKNWKQGFVVTIKGDTLKGKINEKTSAANDDVQGLLAFDNGNGITQKYTAEDIKSYTYYLGRDSKTDTLTFVSVNMTENALRPTFLLLLIDGPCAVYGYFRWTRYGMALDKYVRLGKSALVCPDRIKFKKNMMDLFLGCPAIMGDIDAGKYTYSNWTDMVKAYNKGICK